MPSQHCAITAKSDSKVHRCLGIECFKLRAFLLLHRALHKHLCSTCRAHRGQGARGHWMSSADGCRWGALTSHPPPCRCGGSTTQALHRGLAAELMQVVICVCLIPATGRMQGKYA
jgi:hypothetical protein